MTYNRFNAEFDALPEEDRADYIQEMATSLESIIDNYPESVRPYVQVLTLNAALMAMDMMPEHISETGADSLLRSEHMSPTVAALFSELPIGDVTTEKLNKRFALEVAEVVGPDWAQVLYRFAVLVTKLA